MKSNFSFFAFLVFLLFSTLVEAQWVKQTNGLPDDWVIGLSIDACDSNNSVISARVNGLFKTTDGGNLWFQIQLPDTINEEVVDISMPDPSYIWAVTAPGKIIASTDGGQSWVVQFDDTSKTGFMNYIEMFDNSNGVAMGDAPYPNQNKPALFLRTTNGGNDWLASADNTLINVFSGDTWRRLDFVDPMHGYFYESGINPQKLYKTSDGCANWIETNYSRSATVIKCFDENIILTSSNVGNISRTTDGGNTWDESLFLSSWGNDFEFIPGNASKVFFTDFDNLYFSNDTGSTWTVIIVDTIDLDGRDIVFTDDNNGWILGDNGNVYKTNVGGVIVDVNEPMFDLPTEFSLSQNYPNPFNPSTTIKYTIPTPPASSPLVKGRNEVGFVMLKVYDILGSEIVTLVNEEQSPGNYKVEFKSTVGSLQLASGIYFYRLQVVDPVSSSGQGFTETKKMILLK